MIKFSVLLFVLCGSLSLAAEGIRSFDLKTLQTLGIDMFEQDIRAARATDILREQNIQLSSDTLKGWIVTQSKKTQTVRFFDIQDDVYIARYDIVFKGKEDGVLKICDGEHLSEKEKILADARMTAYQNLITQEALCSNNYNFITLPDPDGDGFLVWAIAANMEPYSVQVGGHYRYTISADGKAIESCDRLFKSCLTLSLAPENLPEGAKLSALTMGWIVSDTPLEIHVFLQKYAGLPFMVMTTSNSKLWVVENDMISEFNQ